MGEGNFPKIPGDKLFASEVNRFYLNNGSSGIVSTIINNANAIGLSVAQNDTTNHPKAVVVTNAGSNYALQITQTGQTSNSTSVGGAINLTNTSNSGAGLVIYSNAGTEANGRLLSVRADNVAFGQAVVAISNDGTGQALNLDSTGGDGGCISASAAGSTHTAGIHYTGVGGNSAALNITSSNENFSAFGITGEELGHGTIKITHIGSSLVIGNEDANAAALSIDLTSQNGSTAAQGIFITSSTGGTSGKLIQVRNNLLPFGGTDSAVQLFAVQGNGQVMIGSNLTANTAAQLIVNSENRGFLPPRMTTGSRDTISTPPAGLLIYNTTTNKLNVYTTDWEAVASAI